MDDLPGGRVRTLGRAERVEGMDPGGDVRVRTRTRRMVAAMVAWGSGGVAPAEAAPVEVVEEARETVSDDAWTRTVLSSRFGGETVQATVWVYRPESVSRGAALGFTGWNRDPREFIAQTDVASLADQHRVPVAIVSMGPSIYEPVLTEQAQPDRRWCGPECTVGGGTFVAEAIVPWLVARDGPLSLLFGASTGARGAVAVPQAFPGLVGGIPPLCGMSGAWDLDALDPSTGEYRVHAQILGERTEHADGWAAVDPVRHADRLRGQRVLLIHGQDDAVVPWSRAAGFAESLEAAGARVDLWTVPGGGHDAAVWKAGARACFGTAMALRAGEVVRRELVLDVERLLGEGAPAPGTLEGDVHVALSDEALEGATVGLAVVDLHTGRMVLAQNADRPMNPASVQKVITSVVVLSHRDASDTLSTTVWRTGPLEDGVVDGALVLQGGGDPGLVLERMWKLALDVRNAGVKTVKGGLVIDHGPVGPPAPVPGWPKGTEEPESPPYAAPVSGLSANYNAFALEIGPGPEEGAPLDVRLEWPVPHLEVVNEAVTQGPRARRRVTLERVTKGTREVVRVTGGMAVDAEPFRDYLGVGDPGRYAASLFQTLFTALGGSIQGPTVVGPVPGDAKVVTRFASLPIGALLSLQNKWSSNPIAEHLLRSTAARVLDDGSAEGAVRLVHDTLTARGIDLDKAVLFNGSGLTVSGRMTPAQVAEVLRVGLTDPRIASDLEASLSIWGVDGTARRPGRDDDNAGTIRVKTGTVSGVKALAGVVGCPRTRGFVFALLVNDVRRSWDVPRVWSPFLQAIQAHCPGE